MTATSKDTTPDPAKDQAEAAKAAAQAQVDAGKIDKADAPTAKEVTAKAKDDAKAIEQSEEQRKAAEERAEEQKVNPPGGVPKHELTEEGFLNWGGLSEQI